MAQRDYILRMIEQMGQILIRLRRMLSGQAGGGEEFRQQFDAVAAQFGLNPGLLRDATPETLVMLLSPTVDPSRCWLGAELLFLDAMDAEAAGRAEDARASFEKARLLFRLIEPAGVMLTGWPEAAERIEEIRVRLEALPPVNGRPG